MSCSNQSEKYKSRQVCSPSMPRIDFFFRYEYLANLRQTNVHLFYKLLMSNIQVLYISRIGVLIQVYKSLRVYSCCWGGLSTIFAHLRQPRRSSYQLERQGSYLRDSSAPSRWESRDLRRHWRIPNSWSRRPRSEWNGYSNWEIVIIHCMCRNPSRSHPACTSRPVVIV